MTCRNLLRMNTINTLSPLVAALAKDILALQHDLLEVSVSCQRMAEHKTFDKYFGCGVGKSHSGRYKMTRKKCLYFAGG